MNSKNFSQIECHPYLNQKELIEFCKKHKIVVVAYSPLFAPNRNFFNSNIFQDEVITRMANKYDKCNAQIVLRYLVMKPLIFCFGLKIFSTSRFYYYKFSSLDLTLYIM